MKKEQNTALNTQDFSLGSENKLYTNNYKHNRNYGAVSDQPKEGIHQVGSGERKAIPAPGMAPSKLREE